MQQFLRLARVAATHPEDNSVDVVMLDDRSRYHGVQVCAPTAGTNTGRADLPDVTPTTDKYSLDESGECAMRAIVGFLAPDAPVVLGFLFPQVNQILFSDRNRRIERHASDVYTSTDGDGNFEFYHPSGTYLRVGTSEAHEDLTGKDYDKKWAISKNTAKAVHVHLRVSNAGSEKAAVDIDPSGNITVHHVGNLVTHTEGTASITVDGAATVTAPSVKIDATSTLVTGTLTVNGAFTYKDGMTGSGGSGASLTGNMSVTGGTLTHSGKNIGATHTHGGVATGSGTSGVPT